MIQPLPPAAEVFSVGIPLAPDASEGASCAHCGLTVAAGDRYCCYGCELAARIAVEGTERSSKTRGVLTLCLLLSMSVMMLSLFLFAEDVYGATSDKQLSFLIQFYRVASAVLSSPVLILLGVPLAKRGVSLLKSGRLSMDLLIAIGAAAAYGLSIQSIVTGRPGIYFDSASAALLLVTLGRYLEASGRAQASRLLGPSLKRSYEPVLSLRDGVFVRVAPALIAAGDRIRVGVEEVVPVDAEIVDSAVEVSLGVLTGEPEPVARGPGSMVPAGAVVVTGPLDAIALRSTQSSTLERLAGLSHALRSDPSRLFRMADRFAAILSPLVLVLCAGTFAYWLNAASLDRAVIASLSVLLVACPCTYGVVAPLVFWLAMRKGLEHGVLIRHASTLEELAEVNLVAFDKTGTLTSRSLSVLRADVCPGADRSEALSLVLALEDGSRHPIAEALASHAREASPVAAAVSSKRALPGSGASALDAQGRAITIGAPRAMLTGGAAIERDPALGAPRVVLAREGEPLAFFWIGEAVRAEAKAAVDGLRDLAIDAVMLTGDDAEGAAQIASGLSLRAVSSLSPEAKVREIQAHGARCAMVGDGLNDAPALAATGPSFAMEGGTDLSRGIAQISLEKPNLLLVPWTLRLARRAVGVAQTSLALATAYNLVFLALAATGLLRPVFAGLAMATSSLLSIGSSLRLQSFPGPDEPTS